MVTGETAVPKEAGAWEAGEGAFAAYARGLEVGDPQPLLDLADDGTAFTVAIPELGRKARRGRAAIADLVRWRWEELRLRPRVRLDGVTANERTAGFEYRLDGELAGSPYRTYAAIFFDVEEGRVVGFREYYGENATPPEAFAPVGLEPVFRESYPGQIAAKRGKPPTLAATDRIPPSGRTLDVAQRAFDSFRLSCLKGNWQPYLDLMAPDVSFALPIPGRIGGRGRGLEEVAAYHRWRWEELRMRFRSFEQRGVTANGATVAVEFHVAGTVGDRLPVKHPAVYVFDVRGGTVAGFREYNGDEEDTAGA